MDIKELQNMLCKSLCAEIRVSKKNDSLIRVEAPLYFPDGDPYQIYLEKIPTGGFRVTDKAHTMMQLSYDHDVDGFYKGKRGNLLRLIRAEFGLEEDDGEFYLTCTTDDISACIMRFGQAITKIYDLSFLTRAANVFYEDLKSRIFAIVDEKKITPNYVYDRIKDAALYKIDYRIEGSDKPLFLFGIPGATKSKLVRITLQQLIYVGAEYNSLLVFQEMDGIPSKDRKLVKNAGGEIIASLDAPEELNRTLAKYAA